MPDELLNILSNSNKDIDNQKLMDYVSGKLSFKEKHEVEKLMVDHPFFNDAVEGLQQVNKEKDLQVHVDQLNKQLNQYLSRKKEIRDKRKPADASWTYLAVLFILALAVLVYIIVKMLG